MKFTTEEKSMAKKIIKQAFDDNNGCFDEAELTKAAVKVFPNEAPKVIAKLCKAIWEDA